ncbi:MAG: ElyC/SanA/YdcF family protein [Tissierellia bacterium]|nr:ElyC/SanA/YdcF family protein [Tissierellia bacterium]
MKKYMKSLKTIIRYSFLILLILFITITAINAYVKNSAEDRIISAEEAVSLNADCIVVLGAGVRADGTPSPMLKDRLLQGIALYDLGASDRLLMSGDNTKKGYDEVNTMKQYAIDKGIASENIFMDHAGISTYDSIYRAKEIFQVEKIIVVTQEYHLYRALYISDSLGVDAYGVSAAPTIYAGQELREIREIIARAKDFVKCIIKPPASILGEVIPVSGDGNVTNDRSIVEYEGDV